MSAEETAHDADATAQSADTGAERWARSDEIPVENPATGQIVGTVPNLDAAALAEMAKRGRAAQLGWSAMGLEGRARSCGAPRSGS